KRPPRTRPRRTGRPCPGWLNAWMEPRWVDNSFGVPPACSTAFQGSVSSTCSVPSGATTKAIVLPSRVLATATSSIGTSGLHTGRVAQTSCQDGDSMDVHVFAFPLRNRFRGVTVREGVLLRGPAGWGEFCPFDDYSDTES